MGLISAESGGCVEMMFALLELFVWTRVWGCRLRSGWVRGSECEALIYPGFPDAVDARHGR